MSMKPDLEGAMKVTSHTMTSVGPGESAAEKAKDILDKNTVSELGKDIGVPTTESSANTFSAKLAAPFVGAAKKLAEIGRSTSTDIDEQAKVAQQAMGRVDTEIHDKASEIREKEKEIGQSTMPLMRQKIGKSNENIQDTTHKLEDKIQDTLPKMTKVAESGTTTASVLGKASQMTHNMIESLENAAANLGSYIGIANRPNVVKKGIQIGKEAVQHPELVKKTGSFGMEYGREKASELGEIIIEKASELKETINDKTSPLGQTMTNKGQRLNSPKTTTIIPKVGHSLAEMRQEAMEAIEGTGDKVYNKAKELTEDVYFKGARAWQGSKDSMQEIHDKSIEAGQEALGKGKEIVHEALEKSTDQKLKLEEPPKNTSFFADEDYRLFTESPEPSDFSSWDEAEKVAFQRARQAHERKAH